MKTIGEPIFAKDEQGRPVSRIGTLFFKTPGLVTQRGVHAMQRMTWLDDVNARIAAKQVLCMMYFKLGDERKANETAWTLPSMFSGRENMLCWVSSGKNKAELTQSLRFQTLFLLYNSMVFNMPVVFEEGNERRGKMNASSKIGGLANRR